MLHKQNKIKNLSKAKQKVQRYGHLEQKHSKQSKQNVKIYENMGQTEQQKTKFKTRHQSKAKQNVKMYRNMEQNKTNNQKGFLTRWHQNKSNSWNIWGYGTRKLLRVFSIIYIATRNRKHISLNAWVRRHAHTMNAYSRCLFSWHLQLSWSNMSVSPF